MERLKKMNKMKSLILLVQILGITVVLAQRTRGSNRSGSAFDLEILEQ
jgi:hypothetical protein